MITRKTPTAFFVFALSLCFLLASCSPLPLVVREQPDPVLQQQLEDLVKTFKGDVGIYVHNLRTGRTAAIQPDTLFPTASMIKVPILCGIFDKINRGELKYNQQLVYRDSLKYDDGVTGSFRDSTKTELAEIVMLMITLSDNTAALWLQRLAGTGTAINDWLEQNGFYRTRVNSGTPGRRPDWERYGWGQTTPREMAELVTRIYEGRVVSPGTSEQMFRVLLQTLLGWRSGLPDSPQRARCFKERRGRCIEIGGRSCQRVIGRLCVLHYHKEPTGPTVDVRQRRL